MAAKLENAESQEFEADPTECFDQASELFTMMITLGSRVQEEIAVSKADSPRLLASALALKHGLTKKQQQELALILKANVALTATPTKSKAKVTSSLKKTAATSSGSGTGRQVARSGKTRSGKAGDDDWQQELVERMKKEQKRNYPSIDEQSKKIVERMRRDKLPAYIRLYNYASVKRYAKSCAEQLMSSEKRCASLNTSFNSLTNGERIYERHLQQREQWKQKHAKTKSELYKKEMREATFYPRLYTKQLVRSRSFAHPEDRLLKYGRAVSEKHKIEKSIRSAKELIGYSFAPSINANSREIAHKRTISQTLLERKDHKRPAKSKSISKGLLECTFRPNLLRTKKHNEKVTKGHELRKRQSHEARKCSHRPEVGRAPKMDRNLACLPIGDYLYSQAKYKDDLNKKKAEHSLENKMKHFPAIGKESKLLIRKMKEQSYRALFEVLDATSSGVITAENADIAGALP